MAADKRDQKEESAKVLKGGGHAVLGSAPEQQELDMWENVHYHKWSRPYFIRTVRENCKEPSSQQGHNSLKKFPSTANEQINTTPPPPPLPNSLPNNPYKKHRQQKTAPNKANKNPKKQLQTKQIFPVFSRTGGEVWETRHVNGPEEDNDLAEDKT